MAVLTALIHNGTYTVTNTVTGRHRTFLVRTVKKGSLEGKRIVSLLAGPDNTRDFRPFAFINEAGIHVWRRFRGIGDWERYARILWSLLMLGEQSRAYARGLRMTAEKRCLICNRKLTHPDSLESGIGPECAAELALHA